MLSCIQRFQTAWKNPLDVLVLKALPAPSLANKLDMTLEQAQLSA